MTAAAPLLAIETAADHASLALLREGHLVAELTFTARRTMAEQLTPAIAALLRQVDLRCADLGAVAVGLGPGSFTSLRVGLATAKGLVLAADLPLLGISSLQTLAAAAPLNERQPVCAVIAAPKRQVYAALYARMGEGWFNCLFGPELLPVEELAARLTATAAAVAVVGRLGASEAAALTAAGASLLPPLYGVPRAAICGWLATLRWQRGEADDPSTLVPQYVLPSEAEVRFGQTFAQPGPPEPADG
ncbi:MAG: tRNA (adenosine(37)-N6)-threonylcarbamoyltransferase complex dimerization subunit type 1 TsaB [Fimbriimonadaceae bacterium]|nr:tRNA (adenosine(37)-N6)-threonylcarbamoyltransferase complex dimerization subunit type 1 TsaB [Fimbriimonadaceae bacterium]